VRTTWILLLLVLATGCSKKCAPGQAVAKGGKCVGEPLPEKVLNAPRAAPRKPRELAKREPLAAPALKPLPVLAPHILGGKTPRWYMSVAEVREQTGIKQQRIVENAAWQIGLVNSLPDLRKIDDVASQVDYMFLGDNLIAYDVSFYTMEEKGQKLLAALREQTAKAYGEPKHKDDVNTDWLLPQMVVHMAVTNPAGLSKAAGHPVQRVQVTWTVPPESLK
jgi:hypothetical protein